MDFLVLGIISFFVLWVLFINIMTAKKYKDKIPKVLLYPLYIVFGVGYIGDVLWNVIFGTLLFLELPDFKAPTLSDRLSYLIVTDDGWRFKIAYFICKYMIEPWDYNHCGLNK